MDAERLVAISRRDLAESRAVPDIMAAAWQAQCLAQAIGGHLALCGPQELRGEARALSETGGRGVAGPDHPARRTGARAARLTEVGDMRGTLLVLGALLGEVGIALVGVACATDEEGLYWQCIEAIDAADESSDHVGVMLRRLAVRDRARSPGAPNGGAEPERAGREPAEGYGPDGYRVSGADRPGADGQAADDSGPDRTGRERTTGETHPERVEVVGPADSAAGS